MKMPLNSFLDLIEIVNIVGVDNTVVVVALNSGMQDFEDAIQAKAAELNGIKMLCEPE